MSSQTLPAPVDEHALEQLEAEFLLSPDPWSLTPEVDLAETLAPGLGQFDDDPSCRVTRVRTGRACCD
jgi:hypothetical protein